MTKSFEVRYLKTAEQDLYSIFEYIKKDRVNTAQKLLKKLNDTIKKLEKNPELGRIPADIFLKTKGYRMLLIDKYIVFYKIKKKSILIYRIIHGARDYNFLFS